MRDDLSGPGSMDGAGGGRTDESKGELARELAALRELLARTIEESKGSSEAEFSRLGTLEARLSDSIARIVLAMHKLELGEDKLAALRAEFDSVLARWDLVLKRRNRQTRGAER